MAASEIGQEYVFDREYVDRLIQRDFEVERHFTRHFGRMLLIKLRGRLQCPQMIADARQETFVRVFSALRKNGTILHPERLGGFVNGICEHVLLELFGSRTRVIQMPRTGPDPQDDKGGAQVDLITDERKRLVNRALGELSTGDRQLLRRLFLEERGRDEVCSELKIDRERLRVRLTRALQRFRDLLREGALSERSRMV